MDAARHWPGLRRSITSEALTDALSSLEKATLRDATQVDRTLRPNMSLQALSSLRPRLRPYWNRSLHVSGRDITSYVNKALRSPVAYTQPVVVQRSTNAEFINVGPSGASHDCEQFLSLKLMLEAPKYALIMRLLERKFTSYTSRCTSHAWTYPWQVYRRKEIAKVSDTAIRHKSYQLKRIRIKQSKSLSYQLAP